MPAPSSVARHRRPTTSASRIRAGRREPLCGRDGEERSDTVRTGEAWNCNARAAEKCENGQEDDGAMRIGTHALAAWEGQQLLAGSSGHGDTLWGRMDDALKV
jgi:hypothetical protein